MSNGKAYEGMPSDHINDFHTHKLFTEARYNVTSFYLCWGASQLSLLGRKHCKSFLTLGSWKVVWHFTWSLVLGKKRCFDLFVTSC